MLKVLDIVVLKQKWLNSSCKSNTYTKEKIIQIINKKRCQVDSVTYWLKTWV